MPIDHPDHDAVAACDHADVRVYRLAPRLATALCTVEPGGATGCPF